MTHVYDKLYATADTVITISGEGKTVTIPLETLLRKFDTQKKRDSMSLILGGLLRHPPVEERLEQQFFVVETLGSTIDEVHGPMPLKNAKKLLLDILSESENDDGSVPSPSEDGMNAVVNDYRCEIIAQHTINRPQNPKTV